MPEVGIPTAVASALAKLSAEVASVRGLLSRALKPGMLGLFPFDPDDLETGWYIPNGDLYQLASAQGQALYALPEGLKAHWGIAVADGYINLPDLFDEDGNVPFLRPVDGFGRLPGSVQDDAIVNITGSSPFQGVYGAGQIGEGAIALIDTAVFVWSGTSNSGYRAGHFNFDASRVVNTASEVRPKNFGMTIAFYLGV